MLRLVLAGLLLSFPAYAKSTMSGSGVSTTGYVEGISATGAWLATQAEAEAGTNNDQVMTPLRTKQAITAQMTLGTPDRIVSGTSNVILGNGTLTHTYGGNGVYNMSADGSNSIQLGQGRTTNNYAYIDLVGDATYTDYGLRLIRDNSGLNASSWLQHRGTGSLVLQTVDLAPILFNMNSLERMRIHTNGYIGISNTAPAYPLDIVGSARATGDFITTSANGFRMVQGNYGSFWRMDGTNFYLLFTASGDQYGSFNSLRPLAVNLASGGLTVGTAFTATANQIEIQGTSPRLMLTDTDSNSRFWTYVDGSNYYVLADRDNNGAWETPHPLQLNSSTNTGLLFGQTMWHAGNDGSGSGLNADTLDGYDSGAFLRNGATYSADNVLTLAGTAASNDVWSAPFEIREVGLVGNGNTASEYAPGITFHWSNVVASAIKMYSDGSFRFKTQNTDANGYRNIFANNLWLSDPGDWVSNAFLRRGVGTWQTSSDGHGRYNFANGGRTYFRAPNNGDGIIATFRDGSDADRVHIAQDGNVYVGALGNWLTAFLNQSVKTDASATFNNLYLSGLGDWITNRLGQDVRAGAKPTFTGIDTAGAGVLDFHGGIRTRRGNMTWGTAVNYYTINWTGSAAQLYIDSSNLGTISLSSDRRLKKDISPLTHESALAGIMKLNPVSFHWKGKDDETTLQYGLIAQEVENVYPNLVRNTGMKSELAPDGIRKVEYQGLTAPMIKAIQELKTENDQLKQNQKTLEQRLEALEKQLSKN